MSAFGLGWNGSFSSSLNAALILFCACLSKPPSSLSAVLDNLTSNLGKRNELLCFQDSFHLVVEFLYLAGFEKISEYVVVSLVFAAGLLQKISHFLADRNRCRFHLLTS